MTQTATRASGRDVYASEPTLDLLFSDDRAPGVPLGAHSRVASTATGTERRWYHWPPEGWPRDGWPPPELLPEQYWNAAMWEQDSWRST